MPSWVSHWGAGGPAGGVDDEVGTQLRLLATRLPHPYAGDGARSPSSPSTLVIVRTLTRASFSTCSRTT